MHSKTYEAFFRGLCVSASMSTDPDETRLQSQVCNWKVRGSWVDVHLERLEFVDSGNDDNDSIVMVNITPDQSGQKNFCVKTQNHGTLHS